MNIIVAERPPAMHLIGGVWPTPSQTLLLRAALLDAPDSLRAWAEWSGQHDLDYLDAGSFRLIGLLYRNLLRVGADPSHPMMPRLKGIYRNFWTRNQLLLGSKGELLQSLQQRGIACLLLKGAALTPLAYQDYGVRPMDDFDLMVPRDRVHESMDLLEKRGWKPEVQNSRELPQSIHGCSFRNDEGSRIDLHWQMCHLPFSKAFERKLWLDQLHFELQGVNASAPGWSAQFLHTCAHGPQYKRVAPVRWLADAFYIINKGSDELDWQAISSDAAAVGSVQGIRGTLAFLRDHLDVKIPPDAVRLLENTRVPLQERWENHFLGRPTPSPWHRLPIDLSHHLRCSRGLKWHQRLRGFKTYFRHVNSLMPGQFSTLLRAQMARGFLVWLPWYLRNWTRLFSKSKPESLRTLSSDTFKNFHEIEPLRCRLLRWSQPQASLQLAFPPGARFRIELDLGHLRHWKSDLSKHLKFRFNDTPLTNNDIKSKHGVLRIAVPEFDVSAVATPSQTLAWVCEPLVQPNDPRSLGLPILAVRVVCIKKLKKQLQTTTSLVP